MTNPTMNTADALMEKANTFLKEVSSTQSPITQRNHVKSLADWAGYLAVAKPLVPTEQHWDRNIIEDNWNRFLFTMVSECSLFLPHFFTVASRFMSTNRGTLSNH
jgi:hypothetical protein